MNPAWSVVFFTVLAGFGQGLAVCLAVAVLAGALPAASAFLSNAIALSFALLAAGLVAFGVGWLVSSVLPASEKETKAARTLEEAAKEHGQPIAEQAQQIGREVGQKLEESAQQAAQEVKDTAQQSKDRVADEGRSSAEAVREESRTS